MSHKILFAFNHFSLSSDWVIFVDLSSSPLILSSDISILLLNFVFLSSKFSTLFFSHMCSTQFKLLFSFLVVLIQGLVLARQVLYHLSHSTSLNSFFSGLGFELRASYLQSTHSTTWPHLQSILLWLFWRWDLVNYLPRLASNRDPPDLSLSK
jgi:hypothetical protein